MAYWTSNESSGNKHEVKADSQELEVPKPVHVRHCIELLRNSIMCQPDLTVEVKNEELGGVTGFGTEHQCKDWDGLQSWITDWETWEPDSKLDVQGQGQ